MADVNVVGTTEKSENTIVPVQEPATTAESKPISKIIRVQDLSSYQDLMPFLAHNEQVQRYVMSHFRDPDTLILASGKSCVVVSVVKHEVFLNSAVIVWAQNPDHVKVYPVIQVIRQWAWERGAKYITCFVGDTSKLWKRAKVIRRMLKMEPYRIMYVGSTNDDA